MDSRPSKSPTRPIPTDRFEALLDAAVDAMVLINTDGCITRFSRSAEKLFGYQEEDVIGHNVNVLMPTPEREQHDSYLHNYKETGEKQIIGIGREVTARHRDGSTFPIELAVGEFESPDGRGFVGILRDITQRKKQEAQLTQQAEELRLVFSNAPMAFAVTDPEGLVVNINAACCTLFGAATSDLLQQPISALMHEEDRADGARALKSLLSVGGSVRRPVRFVDQDGGTIHTQMYAAVGRDNDGTPRMLIVALMDRGPLIRATREAEDLRNRLTHVGRLGTLGEMVSGIAHELGQPLSAIVNYAHASRRMLDNETIGNEELSEVLEKIATQGERAGQVIRGLRSLLRRRDETREALDCSALVREVIQLCEHETRQAGFHLMLDLAPDLPPVNGDAIQIQQVILNLLRNALDAMREQARDDRIIVTTRAEGRDVLVAVADGGPGIEERHDDRIGEPFFTTKEEGLGLGLSICHSIVSAHEGSLRFERNERGGTTFRLTLPRTTDSPSP